MPRFACLLHVPHPVPLCMLTLALHGEHAPLGLHTHHNLATSNPARAFSCMLACLQPASCCRRLPAAACLTAHSVRASLGQHPVRCDIQCPVLPACRVLACMCPTLAPLSYLLLAASGVHAPSHAPQAVAPATLSPRLQLHAPCSCMLTCPTTCASRLPRSLLLSPAEETAIDSEAATGEAAGPSMRSLLDLYHLMK